MLEKKSFALAAVLNRKILLSEPLYLFRPNTTIAINSKTISVASIQEPHSELNLVITCLAENIQDVVGWFVCDI